MPPLLLLLLLLTLPRLFLLCRGGHQARAALVLKTTSARLCSALSQATEAVRSLGDDELEEVGVRC